MLRLTVLLLITITVSEGVYVYSSFWAPLFDPRILNYRVDMTYDPDAGIKARDAYEKNYGVKGEKLIADLGNGKGPREVPTDKHFGDVKFYYTYPGANSENRIY